MIPDPTDPTGQAMRPGYATSEFWLAAGNVVINFVAALLALIHPGFHIDPRVQGLVVSIAPLAAMIGAAFYALSRGKVKAAAVSPAPVIVTPAATNVIPFPSPQPQLPADIPTDQPRPGDPPPGAMVTKEGDVVRSAPRRAPSATKRATKKTV